MEDTKREYRGNQRVYIRTFNEYEKEAEKSFIIGFLKDLPIENLKELINFKLVNPFDKSIPKDIYEAELRNILFDMQCVEYQAKILL